MKYTPPFTVVPMPLNKNGQGPEMNPKKVVRTVYQIWDAAFQTVSEHDTEEKANQAVLVLRKNQP